MRARWQESLHGSSAPCIARMLLVGVVVWFQIKSDVMLFALGLLYLKGEAKVQEKMNELPLKDIMAGEPRGGWGRSILGADRLLRSLDQQGLTSLATTLRSHMDLVRQTRALQPKMILSRTDNEVGTNIEKLIAAGVEIPDEVHCAMLNRRAKALRASLLDDFKKETLQEFLQVICPWNFSSEAMPANPVLRPALWRAPEPSEQQRVRFFETELVAKVLVPWVLDGEKSKIAAMYECVGPLVQNVDLMGIGSTEARMLNDMRTLRHVLQVLQVPVGKCQPLKQIIKSVIDMFKKTGTSTMHRISYAIGGCEEFRKHFNDADVACEVMEAMMPEITQIYREVGSLTIEFDPQKRCDAMGRCASAITRNTEAAPTGTRACVSVFVGWGCL